MKQTANHTCLYLIFSFFLSLFLALTPCSASGQGTFQRTIGLDNYEGAYSVLPLADGYLIAGVTNSVGAGDQDILILKIDLNFNTVWSKTYGGPERDYPRSIIACSDGGYLVLGSTESFGQGNKDIIAIKFDPDCVLEWTKTYGTNGGDDGFCVIQATDGYLIGGVTQSGNGALVIKIDNSGNEIWGRTYGFDQNSTIFYNVLKLDNGNYIFDCPYQSSGLGFNFMLTEITPSGDLVMAKSYNAPDDDRTSDILKIDGEGYYILGHSYSFGNGTLDLHLIKTDIDGNFQWAKNYGSPEDLWASQMILTSNNELLLTCQSDLADNLNNDIIILNCNLSGDLNWAKNYGGNALENQYYGNHETIHEIDNGLYALFAKTSSFGEGQEDIYIIGFDENGESPCNTYDYNINVTSHTIPDEDVPLPVNNFDALVTTPLLVETVVDLVDSVLCPLMLPPLALFTAGDTSFCLDGCVDFTDESLQIPDQWEWYFEGAIPNASSEQSPTGICYPDTGCFDVQLIVSNAGGTDTLLLYDYICVYSAPEISLGNDTSLCFSDTLILYAPAGYSQYLWNTGATDDNIEVTDSGTYWVWIEDEYGCSSGDTINVDFNDIIYLDLGPDSVICIGDSIILSAGDGYDSYLWQDGSTDKEFIVRVTGLYWVEVADDLGCSGTDTVFCEVADLPEVFIGNDTIICEGNDIILDAGEGYASYQWQDGSIQKDYLVSTSGEYWVEVISSAGCMGSDTVYVEVVEVPELSIGNDTVVCDEFAITLDAGSAFDNYTWQDGTQSFTYTATQPGIYWVLVDIKGCEESDTVIIVEDCPSLLWFPNSFTPNGDGVNEVFMPVYDHVTLYQLYIYNRWGQLMFESSNIDHGWDGKLNGSLCPTGVYIFIAEYTDNQNGRVETIKGSVTLLR